MSEQVEVTQADRDAVYAWQNASSHAPNKLAQAFARHRIAERDKLAEELAEAVGLLRAVTEDLEAEIDARRGTVLARTINRDLVPVIEARIFLSRHERMNDEQG